MRRQIVGPNGQRRAAGDHKGRDGRPDTAGVEVDPSRPTGSDSVVDVEAGNSPLRHGPTSGNSRRNHTAARRARAMVIPAFTSKGLCNPALRAVRFRMRSREYGVASTRQRRDCACGSPEAGPGIGRRLQDMSSGQRGAEPPNDSPGTDRRDLPNGMTARFDTTSRRGRTSPLHPMDSGLTRRTAGDIHTIAACAPAARQMAAVRLDRSTDQFLVCTAARGARRVTNRA